MSLLDAFASFADKAAADILMLSLPLLIFAAASFTPRCRYCHHFVSI